MANREENVLAASANLNRNFGYQGRSSFFSGGRRNPSYRGGGWKSSASKGIGKNFARGDTSEHKSESVNRAESEPQKKDRQLNPLGSNGTPIRCRICDSVLHLQKDCPHSYKNLGRVYLTEELSEDIILFTGSIKQETCLLTYEARNATVLDSACTSTVAGTVWVDCFIDSLSDEEKSKVIRRPSSKLFKFGGGEKMRSKETMDDTAKGGLTQF